MLNELLLLDAYFHQVCDLFYENAYIYIYTFLLEAFVPSDYISILIQLYVHDSWLTIYY